MYNPLQRADGRNLEFIELYNSRLFFEDISGYQLSGDVKYTFPEGTILSARGFIVIALVPGDIQQVYGITNVVGPYAGSAKKSSKIQLLDRVGGLLLEVSYSNNPPWPVAADGAGHSLVLARPSLGEGDPKAWAASDVVGGSPGAADASVATPLRAVSINEISAHHHQAAAGFVELYNQSNLAVDISGCSLSDDPAVKTFVVPAGTVIPARGFISFDHNQLGLSLNPKGKTIYFFDPEHTRVLDAVEYDAQAPGTGIGRFPDGAAAIYPMSHPTPGAANSEPLVSDIVINELMYAPISGDDNDQFVELYNRGNKPIDLLGWQFKHSIDFTFSNSFVIPPNSYVVVARNAAQLRNNYPNLTSANTVGDFTGSLTKANRRLTLAMPADVITSDKNQNPVTNAVHVVVDEVTFAKGGRWGQWADAGGSSLELIDPRGDHRLASNWADSDETAKAPWTTIEATDQLNNGDGTYPPDQIQLILLGAGECLVDDVEVIGAGGTNRLLNPNFDTGITNWFMQGDHVQSGLELSGGIGDSPCLHVRASHHGDTGANRIRAKLSSRLTQGTTATMRAKVRWLRGWPDILLRVRGNWMELPGAMTVPRNLGTPGARNSRAVPNAGPAIYDVTHIPAVPNAGQRVVVTARVHDPDGVAALTLNYRIDPASDVTSVAMVDDGTRGDVIAGDGVFSAIIPGQPQNTLVAFHVRATDGFATPATTAFPTDAPARECLVRFGEPRPSGQFGTYRLWITKATADKWTKREKLSNEALDATFVYGEQRVVYNAGAYFSGSPYHSPSYTTPTGNACNYIFTMPEDDQVLGTTGFNKLHWPGNSADDATAQREEASYWFLQQLGLPFNHARYVNLYVNGTRRGEIFEDMQVPDGDMLKQWYPNDNNGDLFKIAGWFEFTDNTSAFNTTWATLQNFTTNGGRKKQARYRWNWQKRAVSGSAHDFTSLLNLVDAMNNPDSTTYADRLSSLVEIDQWLGVIAVQHLVGNWDSYGDGNGQNMYAYKPAAGSWKLMPWDLNIDLDIGYGDGATSDLFKTGDPEISRVLSTPVFQRAYWQVLIDAINGPWQTNSIGPWLDAKFTALKSNGANVASPTGIKKFVASRRSNVLQKLQRIKVDLAVTTQQGNDFTTGKSLLPLAGSAPVEVRTLLFDGNEYPVTWTTFTNWTVNLPLRQGVNAISIQGLDRHGHLVTSASTAINIRYTGADALPAAHVLINEWMAANQDHSGTWLSARLGRQGTGPIYAGRRSAREFQTEHRRSSHRALRFQRRVGGFGSIRAANSRHQRRSLARWRGRALFLHAGTHAACRQCDQHCLRAGD
ncbi:MAG: lamin tail domain-containing protein [Verrucomicrobia bacterium]|nr:lamin tail domain-containing protein [Verrucomicrobiota bacterium]